MNKRWHTIAEVAAYLQVPKSKVYYLAKQGQLPASRIGKKPVRAGKGSAPMDRQASPMV